MNIKTAIVNTMTECSNTRYGYLIKCRLHHSLSGLETYLVLVIINFYLCSQPSNPTFYFTFLIKLQPAIARLSVNI